MSLNPLPIRLSEFEITSILDLFKKNFLQKDKLWLFGSRADLSQKGGDIDLYIETHLRDVEQVENARICFLVQLKQTIGDQKIDIVVKYSDRELPIYREAKETGVRIQ